MTRSTALRSRLKSSMLAELGQHCRPHELTARALIEVGSLAVELAAVIGHQRHADEIAIDEIGEFGIDVDPHESPFQSGATACAIGLILGFLLKLGRAPHTLGVLDIAQLNGKQPICGGSTDQKPWFFLQNRR